MNTLTADEEKLLLMLLQQEEKEKVSPKLERLREPWRIKLAKGGRGAGAKSWSAASILIQEAHRRCLRIACFREVQRSLEESSYALMRNTIARLGYSGWKIRDEYLNSGTGSHIIFRGLNDIKAAGQVKGFEDFDIFWLEEASAISAESLTLIMPTLRKPGSELWATYNPETDFDPIDVRFWNSNRDDVLRVWLEPGPADNPWWTDELQTEMDADFDRDPDEAEHVWFGQPRKQGVRCIVSRVSVRGAMNRNVEAAGRIQIGVDVARFGDDRTTMFKRHGLKVIEKRSFTGQDTQRTAKEAWDMAGRDPSVIILVDDTGVGGGVTDRLKEFGAQVKGINFGGSPKDKNKYTTVADEMWFEFPVDEADIPEDNEIMIELTGRQYDYDKPGRKKIESKAEYKKRLGRSPDKADGLLLTYYETGVQMSPEQRRAMKERRKR